MAKATIIPVKINPKKAIITDITLEDLFTGRMSPYPTVVAVIKAQYKLSNFDQASFFPTTKPSAIIVNKKDNNKGAASHSPNANIFIKVRVKSMNQSSLLAASFTLELVIQGSLMNN
jgi:hypothetical protein